MENLYKNLLSRLEYLKSLPNSIEKEFRMRELKNTIVGVQQYLLKDLNEKP